MILNDFTETVEKLCEISQRPDDSRSFDEFFIKDDATITVYCKDNINLENFTLNS